MHRFLSFIHTHAHTRIAIRNLRVSPVEDVGGWKVGHVAHIADLLRLQVRPLPSRLRITRHYFCEHAGTYMHASVHMMHTCMYTCMHSYKRMGVYILHLSRVRIYTNTHRNTHTSIAYVQALRDIGGIYMDLDVVTLRPFNPLMKVFSCIPAHL